MISKTRWLDENIELIIDDKIIIELTVIEAEEMFRELSQILYGRILKENDQGINKINNRFYSGCRST